MKRPLLILLLLFTIPSFVFAQLEKPVTWSYYSKKVNKTEAIIYIKAKITGKWHIYAQSIPSEAMKLKFSYITSKEFNLVGKTLEPKPIKKVDKVLNMQLEYFEKEVVFIQKIKLKKSSALVKAKVEFMACNDKQCLPADEISFKVPVK